MRALILVGGACLALAACDSGTDQSAQNDVAITNDTTVEVVPPNDNALDVNSEANDADNTAQRCGNDVRCQQDPDSIS